MWNSVANYFFKNDTRPTKVGESLRRSNKSPQLTATRYKMGRNI